MSPKKIVIVGASSGIGRELAKVCAAKGHTVAITARRLPELEQLATEMQGNTYIKQMDVAQYEDARTKLQELIDEMGGMDIIVLNAGIGDSKPTWQKEMQTIHVNAAGFTALGNLAMSHFEKQKGGQLVGVSSVASLRGTRIATVYSATKAYISSYMEGLQQRSNKKKLNIAVTDIRPGFVATDMTAENKGMFWVASAEEAAEQIYDAIKAKKRVAYITRRWWIIAKLIELLPDFLFYRM